MQLTRQAWLGGLLGLALGVPQVYGYGGLATGTGTSPAKLSTGVSGTDPASKVSSTSAPYRNSTSSHYYPSGTAPYSTGRYSTSADPTASYGTVSGGPYKTRSSSAPADPTAGPTHGTDPPHSGTAGSTGLTRSTGLASSKLTYTAPTAYPSEYYYHHKKPKRNAFRGYGYQA